MAGIKYRLSCPTGFTYSGFQQCILWMLKDGPDGYVENVTESVARLYNCHQIVLREDTFLTLGHRGRSFFIESGESFTLEDVAELLRSVLGKEAVIEVVDGGDETTLKVGGEPYLCPNCGNDTFRECGRGRYKCKCGHFLSSSPPGGSDA
jgi:predicted RNA-binding Zn-ribbon protein involved in translation (DUF1610 family)